MALLTDTIGTASRDFSTIILWEASLSAHSGDTVTGECYNDSTYDERPILNDNDPIECILTVPVSERGFGIEGAGVLIKPTSAGHIISIPGSVNTPYTVEWLELDANGQSSGAIAAALRSVTTGADIKFKNNMVHNMNNSGGSWGAIAHRGEVSNNFFYDIKCPGTGSQGCLGIRGSTQGGSVAKFLNNTIFDFQNNGGNGNTIGLQMLDNANKTYQNNIVLDPSGSSSGSKVCYDITSPSNALVDHNMASDTTASGTGSIDSAVSSDELVNTSGGSENLHLRLGAQAINAGIDLGTTANIDINNRDRDAKGDVWNMGAHEFITAGPLVNSQRLKSLVNGALA